MWALAYAAKNRISFRHLASINTISARQIPLHTFLPGAADYCSFRSRMEVIVARILKENIPVLSGVDVPEHIPHRFDSESSLKSDLVNLGVFEENPSSVPGVIAIMDELHKYVPETNDSIYVVPCHGDGLSVERMWDAKNARANSVTTAGRLEGLEPVPQEFHKRCIVLQDLMNQLYKGESAANRGTLFQIRNRYNHRNVTKSVDSSFNAVTDLIKFVGEGLVCLLATKELGDFESLQQFPDDAQSMKELSRKIVSTIWHQIPEFEVEGVIDAAYNDDDDENDGHMNYFEYCCNEDTEEEMIRCSNSLCEFGLWFHIGCIGMTVEMIPAGDWWCSEECSETRRSQFCVCQTYNPCKTTITCCRGKECKGYRIYHTDCIVDFEPGQRFLCQFCVSTQGDKDHIYEYSCAMAYGCLADLPMRDAERENDGEAMVQNWRLAMPQFWNNNHYKYLIIGHKLLADVGGCVPERLRHEILWNRTVNIIGGPGHNLPMDLVNEFLNRDFKENLKSINGQYTTKTVDRISQYSGAVGKHVDGVFMHEISGTHCAQHSSKKNPTSKEDLKSFVVEYLHDNLFTVIPGREHTAFPGFIRGSAIKDHAALKKRLKKYSFVLDRYREILPN